MEKLRVLSLFSGIGAFEKALVNIGIDFKLVNYCEVDKYASKSYSIIHEVDESLNLGDITKVNIGNLNDFDLLTHGSPCQSFSIAGKQEGGDLGSETRSSLMWNTVEIIKHKKPKYVIWENVKNVLSKKHKHNFDRYIEELNELGYISYHKVLNSKDFKIPQNRERIFVISILGEHESYNFPDGHKLELRLKDILEESADEKYYINKPFKMLDKNKSESNCNQITKVDLNGHDYLKRVYDTGECRTTLPTGTGGNHEPKILCVGNTHPSGRGMNGNVYDSEGLSPTLTTNKGEGHKVVVDKPIELGYMPYPNSDKKHQSNTFYDADGISLTLDTCEGGNRQMKILEHKPCASRGRYDDTGKVVQQLEVRKDEVSNCLTSVQTDAMVMEDVKIVDDMYKNRPDRIYDETCPTLRGERHGLKATDGYRVRKLTPREYWRLQAFTDEDFNKCVEAKISNTQLYKQAGNSITVTVLEEIFKNLLLQK